MVVYAWNLSTRGGEAGLSVQDQSGIPGASLSLSVFLSLFVSVSVSFSLLHTQIHTHPPHQPYTFYKRQHRREEGIVFIIYPLGTNFSLPCRFFVSFYEA